MDISIFLARAFGLYLTILSIGLFVRRDYFMAMFESMIKNKAVMGLTMIITLILGILLIISHNIWVSAWPVVITILCWLTFIKGIARLFYPEGLISMARGIFKPMPYYIMSVITLLVGLYLLYEGYQMLF